MPFLCHPLPCEPVLCPSLLCLPWDLSYGPSLPSPALSLAGSHLTPLSHQMPPKRDEAALQEEEELQLAIALSQSEAEEKERMVSYSFTHRNDNDFPFAILFKKTPRRK